MMLLTCVITQRYSTPTNNCLLTYLNTRNQAVVEDDRLYIQSRNVGNAGRYVRRNTDNQGGHYAKDCLKPRVRDLKYLLEQMLPAKKNEDQIILTHEHNDFLLVDAFEI
ncbi:hypothetical protein Tco_0603987 [Tanacetum coccineum]